MRKRRPAPHPDTVRFIPDPSSHRLFSQWELLHRLHLVALAAGEDESTPYHGGALYVACKLADYKYTLYLKSKGLRT